MALPSVMSLEEFLADSDQQEQVSRGLPEVMSPQEFLTDQDPGEGWVQRLKGARYPEQTVGTGYGGVIAPMKERATWYADAKDDEDLASRYISGGMYDFERAGELSTLVPPGRRQEFLQAVTKAAQAKGENRKAGFAGRAAVDFAEGFSDINENMRRAFNAQGLSEDQASYAALLQAAARGADPTVHGEDPFYKRWTQDALRMAPPMAVGASGGSVAGGAAKAAGAGAVGTWTAEALVNSAFWMPQILPNRIEEYKQRGMDDQTARTAGTISSVVEAGLESLLPNPFKGVTGPIIAKTVGQWVAKRAARFGIKVGMESSEEFLQGAASEAVAQVAEKVKGRRGGIDAAKIVKEGWEDWKRAIGPLTLLMGAGQAPGTLQQYLQDRAAQQAPTQDVTPPTQPDTPIEPATEPPAPSAEAESTAKTMVPATNQEASEVIGRLPKAAKRWSREELMTDQGGRAFLEAQPEVADLVARSEHMFSRDIRKAMSKAGLINDREFQRAPERAAFIEHLRTLRSTQGASSGQTQTSSPSEVADAQADEADQVRNAEEGVGDTPRQADDAGLLKTKWTADTAPVGIIARIKDRPGFARKVQTSPGKTMWMVVDEHNKPVLSGGTGQYIDGSLIVEHTLVPVPGTKEYAQYLAGKVGINVTNDPERTDGGTGLLGAPAATAGSRRSVAADPLQAGRVDAPGRRPAGVGGPVVGAPSLAIPSNEPRTLQVDASPQAAKIEAPEIIKAAERVTGAPIRVGGKRFGMRKAGGTYDPASHGIDQKTANDLNTAAHEVGHALHKRLLDLKTTWPAAVERELIKLGNELYTESEPAGGYQREGFAEYVAQRLWGEDVAAQTPATDAWFRETVEKAHPEQAAGIAELEGLFDRWNKQGALGRVEASISWTGKPPKLPFKARAQAAINKLIRYLQNDQEAAKRFEAQLASLKPLGPGESPYAMMRLLTGKHAAMGAYAIKNGVRSLMGDRRFLSKGIEDALSKLGTLTKERYTQWVMFLKARHALEMIEQGKDPGISEADAKVVRDKYAGEPGFVEAGDALRDFHTALVDMYQEVGGFTQQARDLIIGSYDYYVPMMRLMDEAAPGKEGKGQGGKPVKRQTGGGQQTIDPLMATIQMAERFYRAASIVKINRAIYDAAKSRQGKLNGQGEGLASWIHQVDAPVEMMKSKLGDMAAQIKAAGGDLSDADMDAVLAIVRQADYYTGRDSVVPILVDGKPKWFRLNPDLFVSITNLDPLNTGLVLKTLPGRVFTGATRLVRLGATELRALFGLFTNPVRDIQTRNMRTEGSAVLAPFTTVSQMVRDLAHGIQRLSGRKGKDSIDDIVDFFGGELAGFIGQDMRKAKHQADNLLREAQGKGGINHLIHPLRLIRNIFGAVEQSPRKAELAMILEKWGYSRADMEAGREPPIELIAEAMMLYSGVTTDFSMAGIAGRPWNKVSAYTNAKIQDIARDVDLFKPKNLQRTLIRGFFQMTLPTMAYWFMVKDEDWYKQLPAWRKLGFWNIAIGNPMEGGWVLPIPRPFLLGSIFSGLPEVILDTAYRKDPEPLKDWSKQVGQEYGPGLDTLLPDLVEPMVEVYLNHKFFGERPVVPQELTALKPEDQYTQYTSEPSKMLSKGMAAATRFFGWEWSASPMKIDHLVRRYFSVGADLLNADKGIGGALGTKRLNAPITRGRAVDEFYEQRTKINAQLGSDRKHGKVNPEVKAQAYQYESFADLMGKLRDLPTDRGVLDRYITGLALAANGQEPLKSYPNPITDGAAPAEVKGAVLEWLGGKVYSAGREDYARGESKEEAAERARDIKQAAGLLKLSKASPALIDQAAKASGKRRGYSGRSIDQTAYRAKQRAK